MGLALALAALILLASLFTPAAGQSLVAAGGPCKADLVVVLGGDFYGNRILKGAELVRQGYAPQVLASGPCSIYGQCESDLAVRFAESRGYPAAWFVPFPQRALSTREEMEQLRTEFARRGVHRVDLVTSDYHTRRAGRILRRGIPDLTLCVVAAPDAWYRPDRWWANRESRKTFFLEWTKTVADWLGQ